MTQRIPASKSPYIVASALAAALCWQTQSLAADESARLKVQAAQIESLGIRLVKAAPAEDYLIATLPAMIAPPPNARVAVTATFPGTVVQTLVAEGDAVRRGQALAVIASREILAEAADLAQARARLAVAESGAARIERLGAEGIVAGARVDEAKSALAQARAEVAGKSRILENVNADGAKGTYTLTAPIDGVVANARIEAGRAVESMSAPFVVDAVNSHEIEAQVPERLIGRIKPGMRVQVGAAGGVQAKVTSIGTVIQSETRSVTLKAAIHPGSDVVAGRIAMVSVFGAAPAGAALVPMAAVTELSGTPVVFVRTADGFEVRKVTTTGAAGAEVVISAGVAPGDLVVVSGLAELKSIALAR